MPQIPVTYFRLNIADTALTLQNFHPEYRPSSKITLAELNRKCQFRFCLKWPLKQPKKQSPAMALPAFPCHPFQSSSETRVPGDSATFMNGSGIHNFWRSDSEKGEQRTWNLVGGFYLYHLDNEREETKIISTPRKASPTSKSSWERWA